MKIEAREVEGVLILDLDGRLIAGVGDEALRSTINQYVVEGHEKLLFNLSEVSRIDSTGIGELVAGIKLAEHFGAKVKLVRIGPQVKHILNLSRILPLLDFYEDEQEALAAFRSDSPSTRKH